MIAADASEATLAAYALTAGDRVEVELLVAGPMDGIRLIEGAVDYATGNVLVLTVRTAGGRAPSRVVRIPWHAIALIRGAVAPHPATI